MPVVAVTGGVAAGKSTVTAVLADHGALVIDADVLARQAVTPGSRALGQIAAQFGNTVIAPDGSLDRHALGQLVFSDSVARGALNDIVHPEVKRLYDEALAKAQTDPDRVIVYDVPLLTEARSVEEFDLVVVVHAPAELRQKRLSDDRGFTDDDARARVAAQSSDEQRLAIADVVMDTSVSLADTRHKATILAQVLLACWPNALGDAPALYQAQTS